MLVAPFAYLALSARRFVFLLVVVTAPILARHVRGLLGRLAAERAEWIGRPAAALASVVVVALGTLGATGTRPFADALRVPGFGAHHVSVPEGALGYLDRIGLAGNVFNIFQWGGYMAWRDYPRRLPFVDGRGYVPAGMLDEMMAVRADPVRLARLQARYGFDAAIVDYPRNPIADETPDVDLGLTSPHWALVYWDDLSMVYLRRTEALAAVIARDEYRHVKPAMGAGYLRRHLGDASRLAAIETELRRNVAETRSSTGYALLGFVYNEAGRFREAIAELTLVGDFPYGSNLLNAYLGLAFAYGRLGDLRRSIDHYRRAIRLQEDPLTLHNAGLTVEKLGDDREAARYFERALVLDRHLVPTYPALIRVSRRAGREDRVREVEAGYAAALAHGEAEAHFKRGVKLYFEGKIHEAIVEFRASVKSNPRHAATRSNLGFAYYDVGRLDDAFAEQRSALDVDPGFANAHYGLALVHRERGDAPAAREHFGRYLALAPKGYWARKAQTALDSLASRR
jgi:tetratricopeptide (TPR) repeat protein